MTKDPAAETTPFSIEQALTRFDQLIERLGTTQRPAEVEPKESIAVEVEPGVPDAIDEVVETADVEAPEVPSAVPAATPQASVPDPYADAPVVLEVSGLVKRFGSTVAVDGVDLEVRAGQIFGIVGPNGAGKTTTLSIVTGVLRPDQGNVLVGGRDVWVEPAAAKRDMGILPDRLLLFDRLTGRQLLYYSGMLRGLDRATVLSRTEELIRAFDLEDSQDRLVTDYSAGMTRKVALAAALIHSPRLLILDEPFESVDAVSVATVLDILRRYADAGGTVVLSSHSMDLVESVCDSIAVVAEGRVLTSGTTASVRGDATLEERFVRLIGELQPGEDMEWLRSFSV
ncbi:MULTISPECIES: ABC transporter ATP-binding protein [unclassified Salinibacterium]|uniref:ABC transporter ATP-binding protein n=1 Tax=unclassified Salinibacterium TaxID=2632331 RepID=UPI001F0D119C|nr:MULTISPECIES: ABC transporter ATP-binding protein [unclassified Salinibacterium]